MKITKRQLKKLVESIVREKLVENTMEEPAIFPKLATVLEEIWNLSPDMTDEQLDEIFDDAEEKTKRIVAKAGMKVLKVSADYDDYTEELELVAIRVAYKSQSGKTERATILLYSDSSKPIWSTNRLTNYDGWEPEV